MKVLILIMAIILTSCMSTPAPETEVIQERIETLETNMEREIQFNNNIYHFLNKLHHDELIRFLNDEPVYPNVFK